MSSSSQSPLVEKKLESNIASRDTYNKNGDNGAPTNYEIVAVVLSSKDLLSEIIDFLPVEDLVRMRSLSKETKVMIDEIVVVGFRRDLLWSDVLKLKKWAQYMGKKFRERKQRNANFSRVLEDVEQFGK